MLSVTAPPSKSVSHRVLLAAALAPGFSRVRNALPSDDVRRTVSVLQAAGVFIEREHSGGSAPAQSVSCIVHGCGGLLRGGSVHSPLGCDVHESGTTCRLLAAALASGEGVFRIYGAPRMHERPIGLLVDALRVLGADIQYMAYAGCPPLLLKTEGLVRGRDVTVPLNESSQYISGLLMAAPLARRGNGNVCITVGGGGVVSWPYVHLTLQTLEEFGVAVRVEIRDTPEAPWRETEDWRSLNEARPHCLRVVVPPGQYRSGEYTVEGDWSGAACLLAAGAVRAQAVRVCGLRADSLQGDRVLRILRDMGARVEARADGVEVGPGDLRGVDVDLGDCPDLAPTLAALAVYARGVTRLHSAAHLRHKECDRIAAPSTELRKLGVEVDEFPDGLAVHGLGRAPDIPENLVFNAHGDHRLAMACALLGVGTRRAVQVDAPTVVGKSFPDFWEIWRQVLA